MSWYNQSKRHSLASRGIKTAQKIPLSGYDALSPAEKKKTDAYWEERRPTEEETQAFRRAYTLERDLHDAMYESKSAKLNVRKKEKEFIEAVRELQNIRIKRGKKFDMSVQQYDSISIHVNKLLKRAKVIT